VRFVIRSPGTAGSSNNEAWAVNLRFRGLDTGFHQSLAVAARCIMAAGPMVTEHQNVQQQSGAASSCG
jgi:hypothetical protein